MSATPQIPCGRTREELDRLHAEHYGKPVWNTMLFTDGKDLIPGTATPSNIPRCLQCGKTIAEHPDRGDAVAAVPKEQFISLLRQRGVENPDMRVIGQLMVSRYFQPVSDPDEALRMYQSLLPVGSRTRRNVGDDAQCCVNGQWGGFANLVIASRVSDGTPFVAKIVRDRTEYHLMERVKDYINTIATTDPLVGYALHPAGQFHAQGQLVTHVGLISMELFPCTLFQGPPFAPNFIMKNCNALHNALVKLHGHGVAHLDIKPENVFVRASGEWLLGDFDACVSIGERIHRTTPRYFTECIPLAVAQPAHDYQLLASLAALSYAKYRNFKYALHEDPVYLTVATPAFGSDQRLCSQWRKRMLSELLAHQCNDMDPFAPWIGPHL